MIKGFPAFMKNPTNAIASHQQSQGVEGYVFDGIDGSQIAIFECIRDGLSREHSHDFEEYFVVVQGEYTLGLDGKKIRLTAGQECHIPRGKPHDGQFIAGTRTIHAFGGRRAERRATRGEKDGS